MCFEISHLNDMPLFIGSRVGLPGPEYAATSEFVCRHQLGTLRTITVPNINPDCQDFDLPMGCFQHSFREDPPKHLVGIVLQGFEITRSGGPAHAAIQCCRERCVDKSSRCDEKLEK